MDNFVFVGGGHLATALITGLIKNGSSPNAIQVFDRNQEKLDYFYKTYQVNGSTLFSDMLPDAILVLAVRPKDVKNIAEIIQKNQSARIISCVAGLSVSQLCKITKREKSQVVRAMPNLPAIVQAGVTGLYADPEVIPEVKNTAERLFRSVGTVNWLADEDLMHALTAVSGSGPGYVFRLMQSLYLAAMKQGFSADQAKSLVSDSFLGAAKMALNSPNDFKSLCDMVCVPGGTTTAGVNVLNEANIDDLFKKVIDAATERSKNLIEN